MAGQLRVYLGAAPGVGKTYAMLDEVRRRLSRGARTAVVGVDTHGRPATAELLESLPVVDGEPDAESLLAVGLEVLGVDDLARPGRVAAVTRLLEGGVTVVATLDVGEIESLCDVAAQITGAKPAGTVPDVFLRDAAVELVDMTPEALRRRLAHGNVYPGEVDARTANVFRTENLAALRELALRWVADHAGPVGTGERVAVAVTGAPGADDLVRRAARIAARSHASLVGVHVRVPVGRGPVTPADVLEGTRRLLADLDGEYREVAGADVAAALVQAARAERATQLVLGASRRSRVRELVSGSLIADVMRHAGAELDVHVVATAVAEAPVRRTPAAALPARRRALGWLILAVGLPALTALLTGFGSDVDLPSALLLYLLVVVAGAATGGTGPAAVGAVAAFLLANWYFIPPLHHWEIGNAEDVVALVTFGVVAAVVAALVVHAARRQAEATRARAEARMLADMSGASVADDPLEVLLGQLRDAFELSGAAVVRTSDGRIEASVGTPPGSNPEVEVALGDDHQLLAAGRVLSAEDRGIVAVVADHLTAALRTRQLRVEASTAAALAVANQLRTAILAAVSHDLRTPLASIKASVSSLRQDDVTWSPEAVDDFLALIEEESDRLDDLVGNLLDLSRLQTNTLQILEREVGLEEVAPAAVASLGGRAECVDLDVPETLPRVRVDPGLLERALANLVSNAVAWSPAGERVRVDASPVGHRVHLRVVDRGPGIPPGARERVFEPFQRLGDRGTDGVGLGLAVARGFVTAMGGEVWVEDTPGGGTTMVVAFEAA